MPSETSNSTTTDEECSNKEVTRLFHEIFQDKICEDFAEMLSLQITGITKDNLNFALMY